MDALDVAKVCLRRWYVVLPIVLLSIGAGLSLSSSRPSSYAGTASIALVYLQQSELKPNQPDPRTRNPLAGPGGAGLLQEALVADLASPSTQRQLAAPGLTPTVPGVADGPALAQGSSYSVGVPQNSATIVISAAGANPSAVAETLERVVRAAPARAAALQTKVGAPKNSQFTVIQASEVQTVTIPAPSGLKLLVAIVGVGGLAAAGLALLVDRLVTRRRARRAAAANPAAAAPAAANPAAAPSVTAPSVSPAAVDGPGTEELPSVGSRPASEARGATAAPDQKVAQPQSSS